MSSKIPVREGGTFDPPKEEGYENDSCTVNNNEVSYHVDLKYPGANRMFTIKVTNTGTIDAYLALDGGAEVLKSRYCSDKSGNGVIEENECEDVEYVSISPEVIAVEKTDGTILMFTETKDADEIATNFYDTNGENLVLEPGESLYMYGLAMIDPTVGDDGSKPIFASYETAVKFNFTQKTN